MDFYHELYDVLRRSQRGLRAPQPPLEEIAAVLAHSRRAVILTGFPVDCAGHAVGETDGPQGAAEIAAVLAALGCHVTVATDAVSLPLVRAAVTRWGGAETVCVPNAGTEAFARQALADADLLVTIERPGKGADGHFHNMRGRIIDHMVTDTDCFLTVARELGVVTVSIGDGGNELGMGALAETVRREVPCGETIAAVQAADYTLTAGVSNWWGPGIAALLSHETGRPLLRSGIEERAALAAVVAAGGVDGCTGHPEMSVDALPLAVHLAVRQALAAALAREERLCG